MTHTHYKASPEIVKTTFEKLVIVAMNNRRIEYLGGLESTAAKERTQPEEPQRAINLVSIPQNFLKKSNISYFPFPSLWNNFSQCKLYSSSHHHKPKSLRNFLTKMFLLKKSTQFYKNSPYILQSHTLIMKA